MNNYQTLVESRLPVIGKSGNDLIYRCPRCEGDTGSGHLYVNYQKNKFHCFKCGFKGSSVVSLVTELGYKLEIDYEKLSSDTSKELDDIINGELELSRSKRVVDYSRDLRRLTSYYRLHTKSLSNPAKNYLRNRGISDYFMEKYQLLEGVNNFGKTFNLFNQVVEGRDYSNRIMIPSLRRDGTISFYVGRDYTGMKKNKYLNPPQTLAYSSEDVWNLDTVESRSVIICEGVMTAITAGGLKRNAVATYGKSISAKSNTDNLVVSVTSQGEKLLSKKFDTYYVAYDADALQNSLDTCRWLYERGAHVKLVYIDPIIYGEKADVNSIGYGVFLKLLGVAQEYSPLMDIRL